MKKDEKHISVAPKLHERVKNIAAKNKRSMRGQVEKWVDDEEKK